MTTETPTYIATAAAPETAAAENISSPNCYYNLEKRGRRRVPLKYKPKKTNSFLGLYFPTELKNRVKDAAVAERRSMSQYMVMVVEKHFAAA